MNVRIEEEKKNFSTFLVFSISSKCVGNCKFFPFSFARKYFRQHVHVLTSCVVQDSEMVTTFALTKNFNFK